MLLIRDHHCIGECEVTSSHNVVRVSGFDIETAENRVLLSCRDCVLLDSYTKGIIAYLNKLEKTSDFSLAQAGDLAAIERLYKEVRTLSNIIKIGLKNRDVYAYYQ